MALGQFTKEEAAECYDAVKEMFEGIPKTKRMQYIGHLNSISLFIEAAKKAAPSETEKTA